METDDDETIAAGTESQQLVGRIAHLSSKFDSGVADQTYATELIESLSSLATLLRNETVRAELENSVLAPVLVRCLMNANQLPSLRDDMLEEVGRVAANFIADNPTNLESLTGAMFQRSALECLLSPKPPRLSASRALVASLLNAVVTDHEVTKVALTERLIMTQLLGLARRFLAPGPGCPEDEIIPRATVGSWLWRILSELTTSRPDALTECLKTNTVEDLLAPVHPFLDHSSTSASITIQSDLFEAYMSALDYWRICLDAVCAEDGDDKQDGLAFGAFLDPGVQAMTQLLDFVEVATIPSSWDFEPDGDDRMEDGEQDGQEDEQPEDNSRADFEKILSKAKASAVGMVGLISWELPYGTCDDFWARMRSWADRQDERDDLVNCALVALANGARSNETAEEVLRDSMSILPGLVERLSPSTKMTIQHALIGLMRHLAGPPANKVILGDAGVIAHVAHMGTFDETRDMVEIVQSGSAVLLRNLCERNALNAERFLAEEDCLDQMLAMIQRVNTPQVAFEATRVLVSCIRSFVKDGKNKHVEAWSRLSRREIAIALIDLLRRTTKWPKLTMDALVGLALLHTFGSPEAAGFISAEMSMQRNAAEGEFSSGLEVLETIVDSEAGVYAKEIRDNAAKLLELLNYSNEEESP